jgi:putative PEP-CTERM system histidine kinase
VVHNAERHKRNPEFVDDAIATISNSVDRMSRLLGQLTQGTAVEHRRDVDLAEVIQRVVMRVANRQPTPRPVVAAAPVVQADPERLVMVLDHVLRNAQDATIETGEVSIELDSTDGTARVRVTDDGMGMDEAFVRDRLFRPFDTTKGSKGMGIGAYQVREYMRSLGGDVTVVSEPGRGTCVSLLFPAQGRV